MKPKRLKELEVAAERWGKSARQSVNFSHHDAVMVRTKDAVAQANADGFRECWKTVEPIIAAAAKAHAHIEELRVAWERGVISEHDTKSKGGERSNRNAELERELRDALASLELE